MKITLFGCKDTTLHVARFLNDLGVQADLVTISPSIAKTNEVAGYLDLTTYSQYFTSIYVAENYSLKCASDKNYFRNTSDNQLGFCIGWQRLIPDSALRFFSKGVFGMHGSARNLPFGKGRSPMNWAILEGRQWFHTNIFKYQRGVDDGPIVDVYTFSITPFDSAETLHYKNTLAMCHLIQKNLTALLAGTIEVHKQDNRNGESFYPKRTPKDGKIDWHDDIFNIERLIRAVSPPFYGAFTLVNDNELRIYRANVFYTDIEKHPFLGAEFGEVVDIFPSEKFLVRCSGGVLLVHQYDGILPNKGIIFKNQEATLSRFDRNKYGFFDI
mgnify:CR=1 FL=1